MKNIADPDAKPPMVDGKPNPMWQPPTVGAVLDNDTGQYQLLRGGAGGNQSKQPLQYEGLKHVGFSEADKQGVRYPIYHALDKDGKVKMEGGKPVQHVDHDQPF